METNLIDDNIAMNLLFLQVWSWFNHKQYMTNWYLLQAENEIMRGWVQPEKEKRRRLQALQEMGSKRDVLKLKSQHLRIHVLFSYYVLLAHLAVLVAGAHASVLRLHSFCAVLLRLSWSELESSRSRRKPRTVLQHFKSIGAHTFNHGIRCRKFQNPKWKFWCFRVKSVNTCFEWRECDVGELRPLWALFSLTSSQLCSIYINNLILVVLRRPGKRRFAAKK